MGFRVKGYGFRVWAAARQSYNFMSRVKWGYRVCMGVYGGKENRNGNFYGEYEHLTTINDEYWFQVLYVRA